MIIIDISIEQLVTSIEFTLYQILLVHLELLIQHHLSYQHIFLLLNTFLHLFLSLIYYYLLCLLLQYYHLLIFNHLLLLRTYIIFQTLYFLQMTINLSFYRLRTFLTLQLFRFLSQYLYLLFIFSDLTHLLRIDLFHLLNLLIRLPKPIPILLIIHLLQTLTLH